MFRGHVSQSEGRSRNRRRSPHRKYSGRIGPRELRPPAWDFELPIVAETSVRIVHNLIAPKGVPFSKIRRVFSHPVAFNQCLDFFARNPQIEQIPFYDTAGSVKMIMEEGLTDAAGIASTVAAEIYGARILRKSIESDRQNFTRFFLLRTPQFARLHPVPDGPNVHWKTSLVFSTRNMPGALFRALSAICPARPQPDQDRIAASARKALGVPVLCGLSGQGGHTQRAKRAESPARIGRFSACAGVLSQSGLSTLGVEPCPPTKKFPYRRLSQTPQSPLSKSCRS